MDLHPATLGSTPADTSHWWQQEEHPANIAPVKILPILVGTSKYLSTGDNNVKFGRVMHNVTGMAAAGITNCQ